MVAALLITAWTVLAVSIAVFGARRRRRRFIPAAPRSTGHVKVIDQRVFDWETDG